MRTSTRRSLFILIVFSLLATTGCGTSHSALSAEAASAENKTQHSLFTFGIIYPVAHPFYGEITQIAEKAASSHSVQLVVKAPEDINLEQQIRIMETMIKQKVDGIAIDPIDPVALVPVINKAVEAGIPVICFEADSPSSKRLSYIGPDHYQGGKLMGEVVDQLTKGRGMVLVEAGKSSASNQQERLTGLLDYLAKHTEIQVLEVSYNEGSSEKALADMEQMIDNHPHFDTLITLDILSSTASILLWKAKGLNRNALAFGMMPKVKEAIINGQITSVISQNEQLWGELIIEQLLHALNKEKVPAYMDTGTEEVTLDSLEL